MEKKELIERLTVMHSHLLQEAKDATTRGGTMAIKIGYRANLIQKTIDFLNKS